jgi:uncharacterized protein DUF3857
MTVRPRWSRFPHSFPLLTVMLTLAAIFPAMSRAQGFPPISPDELKMTSEPQAPGAAAVILFREVDRDDNGKTSHEDNYLRIKILTEEGRKYADVEIPFDKAEENVVAIHGRTVRPDGSVVESDNKVFEKTVVKAQGFKYLVKTFHLPDVQMGSIIEYRYTYDLAEHWIYDSHWIVSDELFTRAARFSLKPFKSDYQPVSLRWTWQGLASDVAPKEGPDHVVRMEVHNIAPFVEEDFMPPATQMKSRVDFIYEEEFMETNPDQFWRHVDKKWNDVLEGFIGKRKAMEEAVSQIVAPTDPTEVKLRKIYDRVQRLRNTSYEVNKTAQEAKRDKDKPEQNVEEMWKRGAGNGVHLTWLYLALVRAAGFDACGVWTSSRGQYFFDRRSMEHHKLNANLVRVKLNGKDLYFDPGAAFTPFGMLTWSETGTPGLCLDKDGGTWVTTALPDSSQSRIQRTAKLKLTDNGSLEGKVTLTYTGLQGMYQRLEMRNSDDVARKKFLEDAVKAQVPVAIEAELTNKPDWSSSEEPLVAEFDVTIPGWASSAGKRAIMPASIFGAHEKHIFEHVNRVQPIYIEYPYEKDDDVTIELPLGWQIGSVPPPVAQEGHVVGYTLSVDNDHGTLHLKRKFSMDFLLLDQKYYGALRSFFQAVRTADDQQIVVQPAAASASN